MKLLIRACCSLLLLSSCLFAEPRDLKRTDVREIAAEMLVYHVENRSFNPEILRRTFTLYIEAFDPSKTYLLEAEVITYTKMPDSKAVEVIRRIAHNDLSDFDKLDQMLQKAALRARPQREKQINILLKQKSAIQFTDLEVITYKSYSSSPSELARRQRNSVSAMLKYQLAQEDLTSISGPLLKKALLLNENRILRRENDYLYIGDDNEPMLKPAQDNLLATRILKAIAHSLDAHTAFFSPDEARSMRASLQKQFKGIGVVLREGLSGTYIADLIPQGPAAKSGKVDKGDVIQSINGETVTSDTFEQVLRKLQKAKSSRVDLVLLRPSTNQEVKVSLRQEKITLDEDRVTYELEPYADGHIAKIHLASFYDNGGGIAADRDLKIALKEIGAQGPLYGVVLDMRDNSGGFLTQAVKVCGQFIAKGIIVISKYSNNEMQYSRDLDGRQVYNGPLVVLTSKASASAAEVVALALQDYGVAIVVGDERTYGKGSMQYQNITMEDAEIFYKITVGRYYTISGRSTQLDGVIADIHVPTAYAPFQIGERYLRYPISNSSLGFSFLDPDHPLKGDTANMFNNYFPKQELKWKKMLPKLKKNSAARIRASREYQRFLANINAYQTLGDLPEEMTSQDLPMQEAVNIVKDMVQIQKQTAKN
ncbi:MAG: S41 family peptidase [Simkaniaceae bacterium]|nr:S41 family peptidase [Simkaniaceae bacterium]